MIFLEMDLMVINNKASEQMCCNAYSPRFCTCFWKEAPRISECLCCCIVLPCKLILLHLFFPLGAIPFLLLGHHWRVGRSHLWVYYWSKFKSGKSNTCYWISYVGIILDMDQNSSMTFSASVFYILFINLLFFFFFQPRPDIESNA